MTEPFFQRSCGVAAWHARLQTYHARQALVSFDGTYEKALALDAFGRWEKSGPMTQLHMTKPGPRLSDSTLSTTLDLGGRCQTVLGSHSKVGFRYSLSPGDPQLWQRMCLLPACLSLLCFHPTWLPSLQPGEAGWWWW